MFTISDDHDHEAASDQGSSHTYRRQGEIPTPDHSGCPAARSRREAGPRPERLQFVAYAKKPRRSTSAPTAPAHTRMAVAEMNKQYGSRWKRSTIAAKRRCGPILPADLSTAPTAATSAALSVCRAAAARGRRLAQAHVDIAGCSSFRSTTSPIFQLTGFQCCAVPMGTPAAVIGSCQNFCRRRQDERCAAHEIIRRRRYRDDVRGDAETVQGRIAVWLRR